MALNANDCCIINWCNCCCCCFILISTVVNKNLWHVASKGNNEMPTSIPKHTHKQQMESEFMTHFKETTMMTIAITLLLTVLVMMKEATTTLNSILKLIFFFFFAVEKPRQCRSQYILFSRPMKCLKCCLLHTKLKAFQKKKKMFIKLRNIATNKKRKWKIKKQVKN